MYIHIGLFIILGDVCAMQHLLMCMSFALTEIFENVHVNWMMMSTLLVDCYQMAAWNYTKKRMISGQVTEYVF